tara:strand:+ start:1580 stop:3886 length:2307 start_codon:yes stop_codon:yes gene_type:complete
MATVNRYTQVSTPRYNPRSLQELMMVPSYKREQHNAIDEGVAGMETQLAQYDSLDEHGDLLGQEQERLYGNLAKQAELLGEEGFTPASKSNFLRFNKEYQSAIGPQGTIGKIQAAKASVEREKQDYVANATKLGYSPDQAGVNWDNHRKEYTQDFLKNGKIGDIGSLYAPNYFDPVEEVDKRATQMGISTTDLGTITSKIVQNEDGSYILTKGWEDAVSGSTLQAEALGNWITRQINNPESSIGQSLKHQGKNPEDALGEIQGLTDIYKNDSHRNRDSSKISGRMAPKGAAEGADPSRSFYTHSSQTTPIGDDYDAMEVNADAALDAPDATNSDVAKARQTKSILAQVDRDLETNSNYLSAKNNIASVWTSDDYLNLPEFAQRVFKDAVDIESTSDLNPFALLGAAKSVNTIDKKGETVDIDYLTYNNGKPISEKDLKASVTFAKKYGTALQDNRTKMSTMRDEAVSNKGFERTTIVVPFEKTSERSVNMLNALQAYSVDNIKPEDVLFFDSDGTNNRVNLNEDAAMKAVGLFQNSDPSDIRSIHAAKQGTSAGFVITFRPKEGSVLNATSDLGDQEEFDGNQSLEMFVPVNKMYDNLTGARATQSMFVDLLPQEVQKEMRKFISTAELSSTGDVESLGRPNTLVNEFFMGSPEGAKLDFLDKGGLKTPYMISGDTKEAFRWNNFIPSGDLDEQEAFIKNFANSGAYEVLRRSALEDPTLVKRFGLNTNDPDSMGLIEYSRDHEVKLQNTSDIHTLGVFHNISSNLKK